MMWQDVRRAVCLAAVCVLLSCARGSAAETKSSVCSGKFWNVSKQQSGLTWLEIGEGISQCSIRDASSENAKKILSVCNLNADCAMKVVVDRQRLQKSAEKGECDDLCVFESDKIVWVKKGKTE